MVTAIEDGPDTRMWTATVDDPRMRTDSVGDTPLWTDSDGEADRSSEGLRRATMELRMSAQKATQLVTTSLREAASVSLEAAVCVRARMLRSQAGMWRLGLLGMHG